MHSKLFENESPGELPEVARDAPVTRGNTAEHIACRSQENK